LMSQALTLVQRNTEELHIMAGNASIEAARHAEHGSIFRAVADGIEAVAEQSQLALRQIQDVIERNQRETVGVVEAIEDVTAHVVVGARTIHQASDAFGVVEGVVRELADLNAFIASASAAQALQAVEVASMMGTLNTISVETSRSTATSAEATVRLRQLTDQLNGSVATLKVG
jgi:methyl-accepting chemotaxis protein